MEATGRRRLRCPSGLRRTLEREVHQTRQNLVKTFLAPSADFGHSHDNPSDQSRSTFFDGTIMVGYFSRSTAMLLGRVKELKIVLGWARTTNLSINSRTRYPIAPRRLVDGTITVGYFSRSPATLL